jgi:hypothetical protein
MGGVPALDAFAMIGAHIILAMVAGTILGLWPWGPSATARAAFLRGGLWTTGLALLFVALSDGSLLKVFQEHWSTWVTEPGRFIWALLRKTALAAVLGLLVGGVCALSAGGGREQRNPVPTAPARRKRAFPAFLRGWAATAILAPVSATVFRVHRDGWQIITGEPLEFLLHMSIFAAIVAVPGLVVGGLCALAARLRRFS